MSTSEDKQFNLLSSEGEFDYVTETLPQVEPSESFEAFVPLFSGATSKHAPDNLAEQIDNPRYNSGATMMVINKDRHDEVAYATNRFFLQSMSMQNREKVQLLETFNVPTISFFGSTIKVYQFNAVAVDHPSQDLPYQTMNQSSILHLYENHLRGTKLAEEDRIALIQVNNHSIYGYPITMNVNYTANQDKLASFSLSFVVVRHDLTLEGVVDEDQLTRLYTNRNQLENEYIDNIDSILFPIQDLIKIESEDTQAMKSSISRIDTPGIINRENRNSALLPLELTAFNYDLLKQQFPEAFDIIEEKAINLALSLEDKLDSGMSQMSPKLSQWTDDHITSFRTAASQIGNSWEAYMEFKPYLTQAFNLQRDLENFKLQLTTFSRRLDRL